MEKITKREIIGFMSAYADSRKGNKTVLKDFILFKKIQIPPSRFPAFYRICQEYKEAIGYLCTDCDCVVSDQYSSPYCCERQQKEMEIIDNYHAEILLDFFQSLEKKEHKKKEAVCFNESKVSFKRKRKFKNNLFRFFSLDLEKGKYTERNVSVTADFDGTIEVFADGFLQSDPHQMVLIDVDFYHIVKAEPKFLDNFENMQISEISEKMQKLKLSYLFIKK